MLRLFSPSMFCFQPTTAKLLLLDARFVADMPTLFGSVLSLTLLKGPLLQDHSLSEAGISFYPQADSACEAATDLHWFC